MKKHTAKKRLTKEKIVLNVYPNNIPDIRNTRAINTKTNMIIKLVNAKQLYVTIFLIYFS